MPSALSRLNRHKVASPHNHTKKRAALTTLFYLPMVGASCSFALNGSPYFASKNFILFAKYLRPLLTRARTDPKLVLPLTIQKKSGSHHSLLSADGRGVLLVRIKRVSVFCFKEFHSFCKIPPPSAHSRSNRPKVGSPPNHTKKERLSPLSFICRWSGSNRHVVAYTRF